SYTPWLRALVTDIDLAYIAGYYRFADNQSLSASLRYFSLGDITLMDQLGMPQGSAHPLEMAIDAAYALKLSENLSASVALRFIYSDLNNGYNSSAGEPMYPGYAVAADIAAYYRLPIEFSTGDGALSFGTNISNIGSKVSYDQNATNNFIPTNWRLGTYFLYPLDDYQTISFSADANKLLVPTPDPAKLEDNKNYYNTVGSIAGLFQSFGDAPGGFKEELQEIMWSAGAEYAYNQQFFVRLGYFNESKYKGNRKFFTFGAGFKLNVFQIDAGYVVSVVQSNPLDNTLRISLSFDVDGLKNLFQ
ncbi:MAG: type IX secretion system outer membrane channel protein PorV, partial [Paludibacter sp.]|nr:type IX secretion system outer membrane channel protein PorV [Paludibacter sp.]